MSKSTRRHHAQTHEERTEGSPTRFVLTRSVLWRPYSRLRRAMKVAKRRDRYRRWAPAVALAQQFADAHADMESAREKS